MLTVATGLLVGCASGTSHSAGTAGNHGSAPTLNGAVVVLDTYSRDSNCTESVAARESGINPLHTDYVEPGSTIVVTDAQGAVVGTGHLGAAHKPSTGGCQFPFQVALTQHASTYGFTVNDVRQGQTLLDSDLQAKGYDKVQIVAASDPSEG